jgi:hypothetical protein
VIRLMPTVLRISGYRFFFYSGEGSEVAHIHVEHGDGVAKIWLEFASPSRTDFERINSTRSGCLSSNIA